MSYVLNQISNSPKQRKSHEKIVIQTTISRTRTRSELAISFLHKVGAFASRGVGYLSYV